MKKILLPIICIILVLSGCSNIINNDDSEKEGELSAQLSEAQEKVNYYENYYSKDIETAIDKYCEFYLSYDGKLNQDSVKKLEKYITTEFYNELASKPYNENESENSNTLQSTAVVKLFYEEITQSVPSKHTVAALCSQSVVNDDNTDSYNIVCLFEFKKADNKWLINSVENISG
ncbi:MAG: hypothetical protein IJ725_01005 [Ruminococcus sp.]|nr:hypothetical protein [Ruminococcus sp.]